MPFIQQTLNFPIHKTRASTKSKCQSPAEQISINKLSSGKPAKTLENISSEDQENRYAGRRKIILKTKCDQFDGKALIRFPGKKRDCEVTEIDTEFFSKASPTKKSYSETSDIENEASPLRLSKSCSRLNIEEHNIERKSKVIITPLKNRNVLSPKDNINCDVTPSKVYLHSSPCKSSENLNSISPVRRSPRKLNFNLNGFHSPIKMGNSPLTPFNIIVKACRSLKSSLARNCSGRLVGREKQMKELENYLENHLCNSLPGSLYISGAPGTGKTASVTKIVEELQIPKLKTIFLNCMTTKTSKEMYSQIGQNFCKNCGNSEKNIIAGIERRLSTSKFPILIILDEIDQLESVNQKVLYNLFEWPSLVNSKLVLIGIANMLDLTDRILPRLQASQICKPQLLNFSSYSKREIVDIINERVKEANIGELQIISPSAVEFLAGKIAAVAGDARKALDVCRRSVEIFEIELRRKSRLHTHHDSVKSSTAESKFGNMQINIPQVLKIFNEIYGSRVTSEIVDNPNTFPLQQKVLICSLILILKNSKMTDIVLGKFYEVYRRVCKRQNLPAIEEGEFYPLCILLETRGMLELKKNRERRSSKVSLRLNQEEAEKALGDRVLLFNILEDKSCLAK